MSDRVQASELLELVSLAANIKAEHGLLLDSDRDYDKPDLETIEVFLDLEGMAGLDFVPIDEFRIRYHQQYGTEVSATYLTRRLKEIGYDKKQIVQWYFIGAHLIRPSPVLYKRASRMKEQIADDARARLQALVQELAKV